MAHTDLSMILDKHLIAKLFSFSTPSYTNVDSNRQPDQILENLAKPISWMRSLFRVRECETNEGIKRRWDSSVES